MKRNTVISYLGLLLLLFIPAGLSVLLHPHIRSVAPAINALYLVAMCASAWWAGYAGGVVSVFLGVAISVVARTGHLHLADMRLLYIGIGLVVVLLVSSVASSRRRVEQLLRSSNERLEASVREGTAELAETSDRLSTTLASIGDAVISTDPRGGIVLMNAVSEALTGWTQEQAAGKPLTDVFRIRDELTGKVAPNPVSQALEHGVIVGLANHTVLLHRDGRQIPIDDSAAPIRDRTGAISGVVLIFRDVSERRTLELDRERLLSEASSARAQLYSIFQQAPAMINLTLGPEHVIEVAHPITQSLVGDLDPTGHPLRQVLPELAAQGIANFLDEVYRSGAARTVPEHPLRFTQPEGSAKELIFNLDFRPWRNAHGQVAGVITLAMDVSEQVRVRREIAMSEERLREAAKLESLGVMAGGIAHDFNNLLVGIMGNASLALESLPEAHPAREMLENLLSASEKAALLTRQMLAYSGKGNFVIEPLELGELVHEILPLVSRSIPPNVTLKTSLAGGLLCIDGDRSQLQQVVMNLVINAAEACGSSPGHVLVDTSASESGILLTVSDNGSGMTPEVKARIFDPFFTTKFTGRGLGLSAVLGILRSHKASMDIETGPGAGTTFRVCFPASTLTVQPRNPHARANFSGQGTVLVVDDEEIVRKLSKATLERYGYRVLLATSGSESLDIVRQKSSQVSVVLLDLTMPGMTGDVVFKQMQQMVPSLRVILSSGFTEKDAMERFGSSGLHGFLQKPYTAAALAEKVKAALQ
jgi:two-component system, cell cycle sensor histidine kinase and response regulator CckA